MNLGFEPSYVYLYVQYLEKKKAALVIPSLIIMFEYYYVCHILSA